MNYGKINEERDERDYSREADRANWLMMSPINDLCALGAKAVTEIVTEIEHKGSGSSYSAMDWFNDPLLCWNVISHAPKCHHVDELYFSSCICNKIVSVIVEVEMEYNKSNEAIKNSKQKSY